ncbi:(deoxy)nucleoside triphosphate pyrophosphohydrolase [Nesterenkonia sp. F]|uniref:(deoxy)nucleoside triphosphate pyrophosphohydrolase n=1 Tax=Nesterenkonia sp. F TaxID=795955 RepID=UPI000255C915|nr:NUDIX domain-containing protein [Nesterenkonia sp. F]
MTGEQDSAPRTVVVAAALLREAADGGPRRLLIARRTRPAAIAGLWEFPGGKLEPGETPEDGVRRELREELGVEVELGEELHGSAAAGFSPGVGWPLAGTAVMRLFVGAVVDGEPTPLQDHDQLVWAPVDGTLLDHAWIPADVPIVEELLSQLGARRAEAARPVEDAAEH